jgi:ABC-type uncharacterized transport system involved in gliding motility auxiliary subunit
VLMLIHPKGLSDKTQYAIDQFVLRGGKLIVFVDPYAEADSSPADPANPGGALLADHSSDLPKLFKAWGVSYDPGKVIGDRGYALDVSPAPNQPFVRHLAILGIDSSGLNQQEVVTAQLSTLNLASTGYLASSEGAQTKLIALVSSSNQAMPMDAAKLRFLPNPATLNQGFQPTGERYVLAARLQGKVKSAFPEGPPAEQKEASTASHLAESAQDINVIVVADTDLLSDRLWVRTQNFLGQRITTAWANNGDFVINALDYFTGSGDLIGMRGRATSVRPFTRVEALKRAADARFLATEQQLQEQLQETERKLNELQSGRKQGDNPLILTPEQRAELERFQEQKVTIRQELRQVRHNLDRDIESLGTTLKLINIGLMPLLISLGALTLIVLRSYRRKPGGTL